MSIADHAFTTPSDKRAYFDFLRNQANLQRRRLRSRGAILRPVDADWSKPEKNPGRTIYQLPIGPARRRDILQIATPSGDAKPAKDIIAEVCAKHGVTLLEMRGHRRERRIAIARMEAYYRLREETGLSFPQIGRQMGNRDHSTVLHGARQFSKLLAQGLVI